MRSYVPQFANAPIECVSFACTGTSYLSGKEEEDLALGDLGRMLNVPAMSAATSVCLALRTLGAKRIGLVSPYPEGEQLDNACTPYWASRGFEIGAKTNASRPGKNFHPIYSLPADAAQEDLRRREAEDRMPHQVRRLRAEIAADEGVPRGQFLTAVGGDGLRYRTQGFDAPARGNDDLFDRRGDGLPGSAYCKNGGSDCAPRPYRRRQSPVHGYPPAVVQRRNRYTAGYGVAMDF